jgi:hypothetical protein
VTEYKRPITTDVNQTDRIDAAYRTAGLRAPSRTLEIQKLLDAIPTTAKVADQLAQEAITAPNPELFLQQALIRVRDAQAADAFRAKFKERLAEYERQSARDTITQAVEDLTPAFDKLVKAFTTAAPNLPAKAPLDPMANINAGTAPDYKTSTDTLAALGVYAALHRAEVGGMIGNHLNQVLPIVQIPDATVEQVTGLARATVNSAKLTDNTLAIRELEDALKQDIDTALVRVARGDWPTITLALASPSEYRRRVKAATDAHRRQVVDEGSVSVFR